MVVLGIDITVLFCPMGPYNIYVTMLFFQEAQKPYSFIPFGSGARTCLGMNMAKVTMLVFLHRLTSGYKCVVLPNSAIPKPLLTLCAYIMNTSFYLAILFVGGQLMSRILALKRRHIFPD